MFLAFVTAALLAQAPKPAPSATNAANDACAAQRTALQSWLALVAKDVEAGAVTVGDVRGLAEQPLRKADPEPRHPAVTLRVTKRGLSDGSAGDTFVQPARAAELLAGNSSLAFVRGNPQAAQRGIVVAAEKDAPAVHVRAALEASLKTGEQVWLAFASSGRAAARAGDEALLRKLEAPQERRARMETTIAAVVEHFGPCQPLMSMMRSLSASRPATRTKLLLETPPKAMETCTCNPAGPQLQALLWHMAFSELGTVVPVPKEALEGLPFGEADATWESAAPGVVKALAR